MGRHDGTTAPDEGEGEEGWEPQVETCRIVLWRGYRKSSFYVRPDGDAPGTSIGAPSTSFRRHGSAAPDTPEARLAQQELVSRLEANGWVQIGRGDDWYEAEFARTTLVPARRAAETAEETAEAVPDHEPEHHRPMPAARTIPPASPLPPPPVPERRRLDRWRVAAAAGLAAAIGLLGWFATHASSLRAASSAPRPASCALPTAPTRMPRPSRRTLSHGQVPGLRRGEPAALQAVRLLRCRARRAAAGS